MSSKDNGQPSSSTSHATPARRKLSSSTPATSISKRLADADVNLPSPSTPKAHKVIEPGTPSPLRAGSMLQYQAPSGKGKRKADEAEVGPDGPGATPPDRKKDSQRAKFAAEPAKIGSHRPMGSNRAPSSYRRKRARLSFTPSETHSRTDHQQDATNASSVEHSSRPPSRTTSTVHPPSTPGHSVPRTPASRRSLSQMSIPISALVSPHAPSVGRSSTFHMRDPRKPARRLADTGWSLRFEEEGEPGSGSPIHAWMFFTGFVLFPLWWVASFWKTPETRSMGGDEEKVVVDDPQVEHDAKAWRFRCRVMSVISFFTYIPFIVLVAVFAP